MRLKPDLQLSTTAAQAVIDHITSDHAISTVSRLHGGEIAAVYEIAFTNLINPPLILKLYPEDLHWKMQKEVTVLNLISDRLSVSVPRVLLTDDSKRLLGLNLTVMTKLSGSVLGQLEASLAPSQRRSAYVQIGRLLREFHSIPMEAFGYIGPQGIWTAYSTNQAYLQHQFQRKLQQFKGYGGDASLAIRIADFVGDRDQLLSACTQPVSCHNDLHAGNLFITISEEHATLTGCIDFEGALAGDPLMDVAKALYYLDAQSRQAVLEGYSNVIRKY